MSSPPNPAVPLVAGPYAPPRRRYRTGQAAECAVRGEVVVTGISDAPIPWPLGRYATAVKSSPVVCDGLVDAIRTEAVEAIAHHWGVSRWTVRRWRRALGVGRFTAGTEALWRERAPKLHTPQARRRQKAAMRALAARRVAATED
ncbi:MAG TPA: hypothetical protein VKY26_05225 [Actinomycetota bacterium]|nr:hypothetical protein [Actinomycetota bacterium]